MLATAALWVVGSNPDDIFQKNKMGDISKGRQHTVARQKYKKNFQYEDTSPFYSSVTFT
jgi:hypothetical protein